MQTIELLHAPLGKRTRSFDAVDVVRAQGKLISAMVDPKMFRVTDTDQSVIAAPALGMDDPFPARYARE